jgi:hypothetical protein
MKILAKMGAGLVLAVSGGVLWAADDVDYHARYEERIQLTPVISPSARARAMVVGDFDGDGMDDLVTAWALAEGGLLVLYPGQVDYLFPNDPQARARAQLRGPPAPFGQPWEPLPSAHAADWLVVVERSSNGQRLLVAASRGADYFDAYDGAALAGQSPPQRIHLGAPLTAMASGDIGSRDGRSDLVLAIDHDSAGGSLWLWQGGEEAVLTIPAARPAHTLGVVDLDGDGLGDLLSVDDSTTQWRKGLDPLTGGSWLAAAQDLGAGQSHASLALAPASVSKTRGFMGGEQRLLRLQGSSDPVAATELTGTIGAHGQPLALAMMASRGGRNLLQAADSGLQVHDEAGRLLYTLPLPERPLAVLPMRLNADGFDDLVVLGGNATAPLVIPSAPRLSFLVENNGNLPDCNQSDNFCSTDLGTGCGSGGCTLRAALMQANASPGPDAVTFSIGGSAAISDHDLTAGDGTIIDGMTQPGYAGLPVVELVGGGGANSWGLIVVGNGTTVRGLLVRNHTQGLGIAICGTGNIVEANLAGPSPAAPPGNPGNAVGFAVGDCAFVTVDGGQLGGSVPQARNHGYGSTSNELSIGVGSGGSSTVSNFQVLGNWFGFKPSGEFDSRGRASVRFCQDTNLTLSGNVISGVPDHPDTSDELAVLAQDCLFTRQNLIISGNRIGAAADGTVVATVGSGVRVSGIQASGLRLGLPGAGNEIVGFPGDGIILTGSNRDVRIQGNHIGRLADLSPQPVGRHGIDINNQSNFAPAPAAMLLIGGEQTGEGNRLRLDPGQPNSAGILLRSGERSHVVGNHIEGNQRLAIDLQCAFPDNCEQGPTPNDPLDADGCGEFCANAFQNHPIVELGGGGFARGRLSSAALGEYRIDVYAAENCPAHGRGDMQMYLGQAVALTNSGGEAIWAATLSTVPTGWVLTATATDADGNTSEPAPCQSSEPGLLLRDGFES